jgi:filamentous hemagglutinin family protein
MPRKFHPIPSLTALTCLVLAAPAGAQVTADGTLGTTVTPSGATTYTITGGQFQGSTTLLQSFGDFSLPNTTDTAHFALDNASYGGAANGVNTVIGRVTGGNLSTINGQIRLTGGNAPDLFLINPSGIVFGAGATLNVPGSFVASTAENVLFANNVAFGIGNTPDPLLTITAPTGLQLGSPAAPITVQGSGQTTFFNSALPVFGLTGSSGLEVSTGKTLALIGGDVALAGGGVTAPGGHIELGSVTSGQVDLSSSAQGLSFSYDNATNFGSIQLTGQALASTSGGIGVAAGSVQMQGNQVSIRDGSLVAVQNQSSQTAGDITVNATGSLEVVGTAGSFFFASSSGLVNETRRGFSGAGGNISITTPNLSVSGGGAIRARTFGSGTGGNIVVNAPDISVGMPTQNLGGSIVASSNGIGAGGNLSITTQNLSVVGGSEVLAVSENSGDGGNLTVRADTVFVSSGSAINGSPTSRLSAATYFGSGDAGNFQLDTRSLTVDTGGIVSVSTLGTGNAGQLTINATDSIEVRGQVDDQSPSYIGALARDLGGQANSPADAGSITVTTPTLTIRDGGRVVVSNEMQGNGGTATINANTLYLNQGSILTSTQSGNGGNINLQSQNGVIMRYGSVISATAGGNGDGGNITINAPVIAGFENSDIIANAFQGNGGNITITTQGIFGLEFRPQLTPENDITASSQFGVNGTVEINEFSLDPDTGIVELPAGLADTSDQIAQGCATDGDSSFVATGRGGIPPSPNESLSSDLTWSDTRDLSAFMEQGGTAAKTTPLPTEPSQISEITGWVINAAGQVELVVVQAQSDRTTAYATCAVSHHG